jgi:uncharacterized membrane protein YdjX (TVP38/TMEM64 family)
MDEVPTIPPADTDAVAAPGRRSVGRLIALGVLAALVVTAASWLLGTEQGRAYLDREHLRQLGVAGRGWMADNPVLTFGLFVSAYVVCAVLLLPVWWLQMLAGFAFGLWAGVAWVVVASTCGALATARVSRWLGEEWVHERVVGTGKNARRLRKVLDVVGHNGLLVVLISRMSYPIPYGVSRSRSGRPSAGPRCTPGGWPPGPSPSGSAGGSSGWSWSGRTC